MSCRPTCIQPSPTQAHCGSCHHTLSGITAFDRHRRAGECLSPLAIGLRADHRGVWRFPAPDDTKRSAWPQRDVADHVTDQPKLNPEAAAVDLMEALKESLRQARARREATAADRQARLAAESKEIS